MRRRVGQPRRRHTQVCQRLVAGYHGSVLEARSRRYRGRKHANYGQPARPLGPPALLACCRLVAKEALLETEKAAVTMRRSGKGWGEETAGRRTIVLNRGGGRGEAEVSGCDGHLGGFLLPKKHKLTKAQRPFYLM